MANSLGALVVSLGLDSAEFTRGLTKAEFQAKQFARNTRSAMLEVGKVLGGLAIGDAVVEATKAIIAEAAALDDLSDATGASVEALSKLNNQAKISGTEFATLQTALLKLSAGMAGTDEETTKAKEALKALGITTKDPAQAMQEVAVKFEGFADGVNKVGLAVALFGKQGAQLLPMLKDMAALQDVQASVTTKQAKEAEELEKAWRRLGAEGTLFKTMILSGIVPALNELITNFKLAREAGLDFFAAFRLADSATSGGTGVAEQIKQAAQDLDDAKKAVAAASKNPLRFIPGLTADQSDIANAQKRLNALQNIAFATNKLNASRGNDLLKPDAPALSGGATAGIGTRALKEATDEGLRYQQSLEKQLQATLELSAEEEARVVIFDALRKGQAGFTAEVQATILDMARQLDTTKALKKEEEARKKAAEEAARAEERIAQATNHAIKAALQEVESIKAGNEQLREQIAFLRGGQEAVDRMAAAKLADAIASKEAELATLEFLKANELLIDAVQKQIAALRERQVLVGDVKAAQQAAEEAKKAKQFADDLGNALAQGAENAILHFNKLRDVLKNLEQDLLRIITRKLITAPLGDFLSKAVGAGIGGLSLPAFASGGISAGGWATVGEQGTEVVHLPRGAQVIPNDVLMGKRAARNVVVNINVPAGATRSTIDQTRLQFGLELQRVLDRNG